MSQETKKGISRALNLHSALGLGRLLNIHLKYVVLWMFQSLESKATALTTSSSQICILQGPETGSGIRKEHIFCGVLDFKWFSAKDSCIFNLTIRTLSFPIRRVRQTTVP